MNIARLILAGLGVVFLLFSFLLQELVLGIWLRLLGFCLLFIAALLTFVIRLQSARHKD